ncbi:MAG: alpha-N-arabinofuranosidase [Candidatus Limnocylindrales bacterium]
MLQATAVLDRTRVVAPVRPRLFGSFVEHLGRCVYTGIYEPGHPTADEHGFRRDVIQLIRELGVSTVRYPGGNFVSGYRWEDGVGPRADRPARLNLAWHSLETNEFGLNEFMAWTRAVGVEPMLTLNLGTRGILEALDLLEYSNHPGGTKLSDARVAHGASEPHGIRLWCLGNEPDGPWQLGHQTAAEYGRLAAETGRAMRQFDPRLELVVAGSTADSLPGAADWDETVLDAAYEFSDLISLHFYFEEAASDPASFLASGVEFERSMDRLIATADRVGAKLGTDRTIGLSVDEWGIWRRDGRFAPPKEGWPTAPPIGETPYAAVDAVVAGSLLISILKHADRIGCACQSLLVNAGAPIRTEPGGGAWREAIFHPISLTARHARGNVLSVEVSGPSTETSKYGEVAAVDAVATLDGDNRLALFAVNRHPEDAIELAIDLGAEASLSLVEELVVSDPDPHAVNTREAPDRVIPRPGGSARVRGGKLTASLPPASWTMVRLAPAPS